METNGVLDRITDDKYATILVEDLGKEFILNKEELPIGSKEGTWFNLVIKDEKIKSLTINQELTDSRKISLEEKMARLKKRSGSKYKK